MLREVISQPDKMDNRGREADSHGDEGGQGGRQVADARVLFARAAASYCQVCV